MIDNGCMFSFINTITLCIVAPTRGAGIARGTCGRRVPGSIPDAGTCLKSNRIEMNILDNICIYITKNKIKHKILKMNT